MGQNGADSARGLQPTQAFKYIYALRAKMRAKKG